MRLIYLCQNFGEPHTSESSTRHYEIIRRLIAEGARVHLITTDVQFPPQGVEIVREEFQDHLTLKVISTSYSNDMPFRRRKIEFLRVAALMVLQVLRPDADVLLVSSTPLTIVLPALVRQVLRGTPFVFEVRDLWPEVPFEVGALNENSWQGRLAKALARRSYHRASRIIALSPGMASGIIAGHDVNPSKVRVATNAGDIRVAVPPINDREMLLEESVWGEGAHHRFIYGGSLGRINDACWLIDVFESCIEVHRMDARLIIVGDGAERPVVEQAVLRTNSSTSDRILVLGRRPKQDYFALLMQATISFNLVASDSLLRDSSPNKVFESFALGIPVASNQRGWLAEAINDFGAGINLSRDVHAASAALAALTDDRIATLQAGTARAAAAFSWDRTGAEVYEALLAAQHDT